MKASVPEDKGQKGLERHGAVPTHKQTGGYAAGRPVHPRGKLKLGKTAKRVGVREGRLEGGAEKRNR